MTSTIETEDVVDQVARAICWAFSEEDEKCQTKCLKARKCMATKVQDCFKRDARAALSATPIERLREENARLTERIEQAAVSVDSQVLVHTNDPALAMEVAGYVRAALTPSADDDK
jgi:hypothetical protein